MYIMRLDDASEYMDLDQWLRMEALLDKYNIKPIYGIIPANKDSELLKYKRVENFWGIMNSWKGKGWIPALHGYSHVFETEEEGINPINKKSEFAGVEFEVQCKKIRDGFQILEKNGIHVKVFFAPAHTFDRNTIRALKNETDIRIISDTISDDIYYENDIYFVPQQSGYCRELPFKTVTFCYHPNLMNDKDYFELEEFLRKNSKKFISLNDIELIKRRFSFKDMIIRKLYFWRRKRNTI